MKLLPLISLLLVSAFPAQAFETYENYYAACTASTVNAMLCRGTAITTIPTYWLGMLCELYKSGDLSQDTFRKHKNRILKDLAAEFKGYEGELINAGLDVAQKSNQGCPIQDAAGDSP